MQFKRGTAARWVTVNPVLAVGEPGFETDTGKQKIGNGTATWSALPYQGATVSPPLRTITTTDTAIAVGDANGTVVVNSAVTRAVTVPADTTANLPIGSQVRVVNIGTAAANVIDGTGGGTAVSFTLAQYDTARMLKVAANTWVRA